MEGLMTSWTSLFDPVSITIHLSILLLSMDAYDNTDTPHLREYTVTPKLNWSEAQSFCRSKNSDLLTIYSLEELPHLLVQNKVLWIGYHNRLRASDGTPVDDLGPFPTALTSPDKKCASVGSSSEWRMCSDTLPPLCYGYNGSSLEYHLGNQSMSWADAQSYCREQYVDLASNISVTQDSILGLLAPSASMWIGVKFDDRTLEWSDGKNIAIQITSTDCNTSNTIEDHNCYEINPHFDCRLRLGKCGVERQGLCYKDRIKVHLLPLTWENAFNFCKDKNSSLLTINNKVDQAILEKELSLDKMAKSVSGPMWLGLRQSRFFGFWIWTSDKIVEHPNWKDGREPELPMSNHCGAISQKDGYKWTDKDCRFKLPFLCEEQSDVP